jgi:hypothetical protein
MAADLSGGVDWARVLFGQNAVHVPMWMYVQDGGPDHVSFVGGSRAHSESGHPLRYGSPRTHQLVIGELVVRPHAVLGTDNLRGMGLTGLAMAGHDVDHMLATGPDGHPLGEVVLAQRPRTVTAWSDRHRI